MVNLTVSLAVAFASLPLQVAGPAVPAVGTVPFILDDNRMFAEVAFVRPDGTVRHALASVDLGTPVPVTDAPLSRELQIDRGQPLRLRVGQLEIRIETPVVQVTARYGQDGPGRPSHDAG